MNIERKETQVNADAWWFKYYLWLYNADPKKVDFCKLFWGFLFAIPVTIIVLFFYPLVWIGDKVHTAYRAKWPKKVKDEEYWVAVHEYERQSRAKAAERKDKWQDFFSKLGEIFTKPFFRWLGTAIVIIAGLALFAAIGYGIYLLIIEGLILIVLAYILGILLGALIFVGIIAFFSSDLVSRKWNAFWHSGFWSAFKMGFKAIKYKTCPVIEVVNDNPPETFGGFKEVPKR
jgi:hypothetical protein